MNVVQTNEGWAPSPEKSPFQAWYIEMEKSESAPIRTYLDYNVLDILYMK